MIRTPRSVLPFAAAVPITPAQTSDVKGIHEKEDGQFALKPDSGLGIEMVTSDEVPGKTCNPIGAQIPVLSLPAAPPEVAVLERLPKEPTRRFYSARWSA